MEGPLLLSHELNHDTPGFGGKAQFEHDYQALMGEGRSCNESALSMPLHLGTHIDLPYHFDDQGIRLHQTQPSDWFFSKPYCVRVNAQANELLDLAAERESIPIDCDFLAIQTGWETHRGQNSYWESNPGVRAELGVWLRKHRPGVRVLALDTISLTAFQHREAGREAHRAFLGQGQGHPIWIIEDAKLSLWPKQKAAKILVSPLWIRGAEGAPVTLWWMP